MPDATGRFLPVDPPDTPNGPDTADWTPEPRPIPAELDDDFDHADFPPKPVYFPPLSERLPAATVRQLMEMAHGKAPTDD